jgi:vitamin K-dependent gamma-carboxylase
VTTTDPIRSFLERARAHLTAPRDAAGLAVFRALFGLLVSVSALRFLHYGWVDQLFVGPTYFFKYWGFEWVEPLSRSGMHAVFWALAVLGVMVTTGTLYRLAMPAVFVLVSYVQLIDVTNYLNHYYLVSLLALLMSLMPLGTAYGVDRWLAPRSRRHSVPAWCIYLLRFQVAVVYFYAGVAKLGADWLLQAQPLDIWLSARTHVPLVGAWLDERWVAYAMSWAGFLFDTTIALWLSLRRTRAAAFVAVVCFHAVTGLLFPIGMFPWIMVTAATVFFEPSWPRRWLRLPAATLSTPSIAGHSGRPRLFVGALAVGTAYMALQVLIPVRTHLYGGDVRWHEQGMRFSWRVMVREKNAAVTYYVETPSTGRLREVTPSRYLDDRQAREFATQPDLVAQLARRIGQDYSRADGEAVIVRADVKASLNGRLSARMIDPNVDLAHEADGFAAKPWILPAPSTHPLPLRSPASPAWHASNQR